MGGDASGGSVEGHGLISVGSGWLSTLPLPDLDLASRPKGTAVMAAMPALGPLMRTDLELRHILVQVEKLPEGMLTAVRSSISGPVRRPIFVFPRKGSMAEYLVIMMDLPMFFRVRFSRK